MPVGILYAKSILPSAPIAAAGGVRISKRTTAVSYGHMEIKTRRDRWAELHRSLLWMDLQRYWTALEHCAAGRNRKAVYRSTRNYNPHHHLIGVCGEFVYACHAGVTMSFVVDEFKGDGAVDFTIGTESVQVKTVPYLPSKWRRGAVTLVEFPDVNVDDMAAYYVLVTVDLTRQRGSIIGYADEQRMARAPIMNFGHGERRALRAVDLEPGIPRFEDPLPANFRAWQAARQNQLTKRLPECQGSQRQHQP